MGRTRGPVQFNWPFLLINSAVADCFPDVDGKSCQEGFSLPIQTAQLKLMTDGLGAIQNLVRPIHGGQGIHQDDPSGVSDGIPNKPVVSKPL